MSTAWTLAASDICTDALQCLGVIGDGDTPSGDEMQTALRGLDIVLKELPLAGYTWPKLSGEVALTWTGIQTMVLPTDYYGYPTAWKTLNGQKVPLTQIGHGTWVQMLNRAATGTVTQFYVSPAGEFYVWPMPSADPVVTLQYQRIVDDSTLSLSPDVLQVWMGALGYGVANEIGMKVSAPQAIRAEVAQRWAAKKALALQNSISYEPICFGSAD
jgi:hypothetical protein